jgi:hypothetical protein
LRHHRRARRERCSVFIRNCHNCKFVVVARQLRMRDCTACGIALHCRTKPAVEACSGLELRCFCYPYAGLAAQMRACKLSPLANFWGDVWDFTPAGAAGATPGVRQSQPPAAPNWRAARAARSEAELPVARRLQAFLFGCSDVAAAGGGSDGGGTSGDGVLVAGVGLEGAGGCGAAAGVGDAAGNGACRLGSCSNGAAPTGGDSEGRGSGSSQPARAAAALPPEVVQLLEAAAADPLGPDALAAIPTGGQQPPSSLALRPAAAAAAPRFLFLLFPPGCPRAAIQRLAAACGRGPLLAPLHPSCCACGWQLERANEAAPPQQLLRQMAAAAGWPYGAVARRFLTAAGAGAKQHWWCIGWQPQAWQRQWRHCHHQESDARAAPLPTCTGLELSWDCCCCCCKAAAVAKAPCVCEQEAAAVVQEAAQQLGAVASSSPEVARMFRFLGMSG